MTCKSIDLALQGGGAHGAFTWGVLDKLLEDSRVKIEAISATSAGAMNAVVLADGLIADGTAGARAALENFWRGVSQLAMTSPIRRSPLDVLTDNWSLEYSPGYLFFDLLSRVASPYELNPLNINPLRDLLERSVDFDRIKRCDCLKLFISATSVRTGRVKVFKPAELSLNAVMASACVPSLFQAVEVDGDYYWDGGFMGNPVLFPFIYNCTARDIVIVQINPLERNTIPQNARDIYDRLNEITFNSSLLAEFRAIDFVRRLLDEGSLDRARYKKMLIHMIEAEDALEPLKASSKLNAEWDFLAHLREIGRATAATWLDRVYAKLGVDSTVDVRRLYAGEVTRAGGNTGE